MSIGRIAGLVSTGVVILAIIAGLVLSGPPSEQRLKRFDESRVSDLRNLNRALYSYWKNQRELPQDLTALVDGLRLTRMPSDPFSGLPYDYEVDDPNHYRLCAQFDRSSGEDEAHEFWAHPEGRKCYTFEVGGSGMDSY